MDKKFIAVVRTQALPEIAGTVSLINIGLGESNRG